MPRRCARASVLLVLPIAVALLAPLSNANAGNPAAPAPVTSASLAKVLRPDGTVRTGGTGSFDASGYRIELTATGAPRFVPHAAGSAGSAPDSSWDGRFGLPGTSGSPGVSPYVDALAVSGSNVYVGGEFTRVGGFALNSYPYLAVWNPQTGWSTVGSSAPDGPVYAIAISGSTVYVGGSFTHIGGTVANGIAEWNGSSWSALGTGLGAVTIWCSSTHPLVQSLAVVGTDLYVGGCFDHAGSVAASSIARWNGSAWNALGAGVSYSQTFGADVHALLFVNALLYVGGYFQNAGPLTTSVSIAAYNPATTAWSSLGTGVHQPFDLGTVWSLTSDASNNLYVGGQFSTAGSVAASSVAKWNGSTWSALGSGLMRSGAAGRVKALAYVGTTLYAGGDIDASGATTLSDVAQWNGSAWSWSGGGISGSSNSGQNIPVRAAVRDGSGGVWFGGDFFYANSLYAYHLAHWTGSWDTAGQGAMESGTTGSIKALGIGGDGSVYAAGWTTQHGPVATNSIGRWDGAKWSALSSGVADASSGNGRIEAVYVNGTDVYVGGWFASAGGVSASNVAKWNGSQWSALGKGVNGEVYSLTGLNGYLYAGGQFTVAGALSVGNVARWDLTAGGWSSIGGQLLRSCNSGCTPPIVYAVATWGGRYVIFGGLFDTISASASKSAPALAMWDTQATVGQISGWSVPGDGMQGASPSVSALAVSSNTLYVGGTFTGAGDGQNGSNSITASDVASLNLSTNQWSQMGTGADGAVHALAVSGSAVYAGGVFIHAGGVTTNGLATWSGGTWSSLGSGLFQVDQFNGAISAADVQAIAVGTDALYVGGAFASAGNKPSFNFARWTGLAAQTTATITTPKTLSASAVATFSGPVHAVSKSNFVVRIDGSTANLAGSVTCKDASSTKVDCAAGPVTTASWKPSKPLVAGEHYTAFVDPSGVASPILDTNDAAVAPVSKSFRAELKVDDAESGVTDAWRTVSDANASGGSYTIDRATGATASFAFPGTSITWTTVTGPDHGIAAVSIDGVSKGTFDDYSAAKTYGVGRSFTGLSSGKHTLVITLTGTKNASSSDSFVVVDAFTVGSTTYQTPSATYTWSRLQWSGAYKSYISQSDQNGASITFVFRGTAVTWFTWAGTDDGIESITLDGASYTADDYAASGGFHGWALPGLSDTQHTLVIKPSGMKNSSSSGFWVRVDEFQVT